MMIGNLLMTDLKISLLPVFLSVGNPFFSFPGRAFKFSCPVLQKLLESVVRKVPGTHP
jgi:hypothetical protein